MLDKKNKEKIPNKMASPCVPAYPICIIDEFFICSRIIFDGLKYVYQLVTVRNMGWPKRSLFKII